MNECAQGESYLVKQISRVKQELTTPICSFSFCSSFFWCVVPPRNFSGVLEQAPSVRERRHERPHERKNCVDLRIDFSWCNMLHGIPGLRFEPIRLTRYPTKSARKGGKHIDNISSVQHSSLRLSFIKDHRDYYSH
jgi:hypothetical protein